MRQVRAFVVIVVMLTISANLFSANIEGYDPYKAYLIEMIEYDNLAQDLRMLSGDMESPLGIIETRHAHSPESRMGRDFLMERMSETGLIASPDSHPQMFDISAISASDGMIYYGGRHGLFMGDPPVNLTDTMVAVCPFIVDVAADSEGAWVLGYQSTGSPGIYNRRLLKYFADTGWDSISVPAAISGELAAVEAVDGVLFAFASTGIGEYNGEWSTRTFTSIYVTDAVMVSADTGLVLTGTGFVYTEDGFETTESHSIGGFYVLYDAVWTNSSYIFTGEGGAMYIWDGPGAEVRDVITPTSDMITDIAFTNYGEGFFSTETGEIFRTLDGGEIWEYYASVSDVSPTGSVTSLDALEIFGDDLYAGGVRSTLIKSDGLGEDFAYLHSDDNWTNVMGEKEGRVVPESLVVYTAHYDAVSEDPFITAPGADDNGTGTVIGLEIARILSSLRTWYSGRILLTEAEEIGLWGGSTHLRAYPDDSYIACVNVDQVGYSPEGAEPKLKVNGAYNEGSMLLSERLVNEINRYSGDDVSELRDLESTLYSDHYPFWEAGYSAVTIEEWTRTPHYHTTGDTWETIDSAQFHTAARAALSSMLELLKPIANIRGRIADGRDDVPIEDATIWVMDSVTTSDEMGLFFISYVPMGVRDILVTAPGYDTTMLRVHLPSETAEGWYDLYLFPPGEREHGIFISELLIDDDMDGESFGDDNGTIRAGERIELWLTIFSTIPETTREITATLTDIEGDFTVLADEISLPDLRAYDRVISPMPLKFRMGYTFSDDDEISFTISLYSDGELLLSERYTLGGSSISEALPESNGLTFYPNPANSSTRISGNREGPVYFYDSRGRLVAQVDGDIWDFTDNSGKGLPSGVYSAFTGDIHVGNIVLLK